MLSWPLESHLMRTQRGGIVKPVMGGPPSRLLSPETSGDSLPFSKIRDLCEILWKRAESQ